MYRADWIAWINNPITWSHMGGVWKRQIKTVRDFVKAWIKTQEKTLTNESFIYTTSQFTDHEIKSSTTTSRMLFISWYLLSKALEKSLP